jgi:hypothetical protein
MIDAKPVPRWLMLVGSVGIAFHLVAVVVMVLASRSGPWPSPYGPSNQEPPPFAVAINDYTGRYYLQPLQLVHNYHFISNRTDLSSVRFEVRLKDAKGDVIETLQFPEEGANFWVRHRQGLLAHNLADDQLVESNRQNTLNPEGQVERLLIWRQSKPGGEFTLQSVPVSSLKRTQMEEAPSAWAQLLAKAYVRYLVQKRGADSGELIRHSRNPVPPIVVLAEPRLWPQNLFDEKVADFTEREP